MKLTDKDKRRLRRKAVAVDADDEQKVIAGYKPAEKKAQKRGASHSLLKGIRLLWEMLCDGEYSMSFETRSWIIFGLLYFITPWDLIPDMLPGAGYVDDVIVVSWVLSVLGEEIDSYRRRGKPG